MPISLFVDAPESLPAELQTLYVAKDGRYQLDIPDLAAHIEECAAGVHRALKAERENNKELKNLGRTPTEIKAILADVESTAANSDTFKTMLAQHESNWGVEKAALQNEIKTTRDHEHSVIHEAVLVIGLTKARATAGGLKALPKLLENRFRVDAEGGKRSITILDEAGAPMQIEEAGSKRAATFGDLFAETIKAWPSFFEGTGAGGGAPPKSRQLSASKVLSRGEFEALSPVERSEKMRSGWTLQD
jgi:hypothetical protein